MNRFVKILLVAAVLVAGTARPWRSGDTAVTAAEPRAPVTLKGHTSFVFAVAFSPDGKTLASGSDDKTIILWNVATGMEQATLKGHTDKVRSVSFSPDGKT